MPAESTGARSPRSPGTQHFRQEPTHAPVRPTGDTAVDGHTRVTQHLVLRGRRRPQTHPGTQQFVRTVNRGHSNWFSRGRVIVRVPGCYRGHSTCWSRGIRASHRGDTAVCAPSTWEISTGDTAVSSRGNAHSHVFSAGESPQNSKAFNMAVEPRTARVTSGHSK